jgi:hypothetical protein
LDDYAEVVMKFINKIKDKRLKIKDSKEGGIILW